MALSPRRRSASKNAIKKRPPTPSTAKAASDQPRPPEPSVSAQVVRPRPTVTRAAPIASSESEPPSKSTLTYRYARTMAAAASGRLIRKTNRQLPASISQPPSTGPNAPAAAPTAAQIPIARPFASPAKL